MRAGRAGPVNVQRPARAIPRHRESCPPNEDETRSMCSVFRELFHHRKHRQPPSTLAHVRRNPSVQFMWPHSVVAKHVRGPVQRRR
eukprot:3238244-Prymnesium_polylepis.1